MLTCIRLHIYTFEVLLFPPEIHQFKKQAHEMLFQCDFLRRVCFYPHCGAHVDST